MTAEKKSKKKLGRPRKFTSWTAELLAERAREYFDKCDSRRREEVVKGEIVEIAAPEPYSIEGLCVYLDITRHQFDVWRKQDTPLGERAARIHLRITANRIAGALDGSQNSSFAQFMLKNNNAEDYRDRVEVENTVAGEVVGLLEKCVRRWQI